MLLPTHNHCNALRAKNNPPFSETQTQGEEANKKAELCYVDNHFMNEQIMVHPKVWVVVVQLLLQHEKNALDDSIIFDDHE